MRNHGLDPALRVPVMLEKLAAVKALWTQDTPEFHGRYVSFGPCRQEPRPVQTPHPPVLIGGGAAGVLDRVVAHADGWCPVLDDGYEVLDRVSRLRDLGEAAGRRLSVTVFAHAARRGRARVR